MGVIGNTIGTRRFADLPITAGASPSVSITADRLLDIIGVEVFAAGITASAATIGGATSSPLAISSFTNNYGSVFSAHSTAPVPAGATGGTGGALQNNMTAVGNVNWAPSGVAQQAGAANGTGTFVDRNGSAPNQADVTPLVTGIVGGSTATLSSALSTSGATTTLPVVALTAAVGSGSVITITTADGAHTQNFTASAAASVGATSITITSATPNFAYPTTSTVSIAGQVVAINLTGTATVLANLPAADGNGFITIPVGNVQTGFTYGPVDSIPFKVKATDTLLDTFAGMVRVHFRVPVSDPNTSAKAAGTYPNNGVQKGSGGLY